MVLDDFIKGVEGLDEGMKGWLCSHCAFVSEIRYVEWWTRAPTPLSHEI